MYVCGLLVTGVDRVTFYCLCLPWFMLTNQWLVEIYPISLRCSSKRTTVICLPGNAASPKPTIGELKQQTVASHPRAKEPLVRKGGATKHGLQIAVSCLLE